MDGKAVVFTGGRFNSPFAKTAHGLVRGTERYEIVGLLDGQDLAGSDAGAVLDGRSRNIPIYSDLDSFLKSGQKADYFIIGIASAGGKIPEEWYPILKKAIQSGLSVVNGLHDFLSEQPEMLELAMDNGVDLIDIRKPKPRGELHFWDGSIHQVTVPKIAVLGSDCAVGKRTTARLLMETLNQFGIKSEMVYTGQTGWMQGGKYGFIFDSTVNDFVSGELEKAIVTCHEEAKPEIILMEGQAALLNPSGPCGSEFLVSGMADAVILVHPEGRMYYKGWEETGRTIPPVSHQVNLIGMYGVPTIGLALNTQHVPLMEARQARMRYQNELGIPACLPIEEGVHPLLQPLKRMISEFKTYQRNA
ncbi:DUF1611 domain-containing protein [Pontibacter sp. G13]|uniref:DUF1611 domain-containing protein n=1 Tax=Pontibacter sp. G13 TaxID=3074898 RepID=UPI002889BAA1|nr:DUF1611 domain-containing protein [Pontibacter sp. G13]WNJ16136.1 DUF1611 domain-containing protein [Pontibacter sp. G13]